MLFDDEVETIHGLDGARDSRHEEAQSLVAAGHEYWGIYTYGYVLELFLKTSYFRRCGLTENDDAAWFRQNARHWAGVLGIRRPRNLHDLVFWAELLLAERTFAGEALAVNLANEFMLRVHRVAGHWREDMRYHPSVGSTIEADEVQGSVDWVLAHQPYL